jgi:hypothetical protein
MLVILTVDTTCMCLGVTENKAAAITNTWQNWWLALRAADILQSAITYMYQQERHLRCTMECVHTKHQ